MSRIRPVSRREVTEPRMRYRFPARPADRPVCKASLLRATLQAVAEIMEQAEPALMRLERIFSGAPVQPRQSKILKTIAKIRQTPRLCRQQIVSVRAAHVNCIRTYFDWRHDGCCPQGYVFMMMAAVIKRSISKTGTDMSLPGELTDELDADVERILGLGREARLASTNFNLCLLELLSPRWSEEYSGSWTEGANLLDVILHLKQEYLAAARHRCIEIACDEADLALLPDVLGDVGTVVENLICNAVRYASGSSDIIVRGVKSEDSGLCGLVVENRGSGIRTSQLRRVFEPGYRSARATPGAGLGLFIVRELVELCGGRVEISSTPIDRKESTTRVTVLFPVFATSSRADKEERQGLRDVKEGAQ